MAWVDAAAGAGDVYYRRSTDDGATFGAARNLSEEGITPEETARDVRVLALGNRVYLTWVEGGLRFRSSEDRGATFGPVLELTSYPEGGLQLAASGDNVYMDWYRSLEDEVGEIFFVRSPVAGRVFADIEDVNRDREYGGVRLAAQGENVYVLWDDGGRNDGADLFFRRSTDAGITFGPILRLTQTEGESDQQQLAVAGNNVYVLWSECDWPTCEVRLRKSTDAGETFGPEVKVSQTPARAFDARLVVRDSRVFVSWTGQTPERYESDIYLALSVDGGATFFAPVNVSATEADSRDARLAPAGVGVRLVWTEGYNGEREVYTRATLGFGLTLGAAENLSRTTPGDSGEASITSSRCGAQTHVVWLEGTESGNSVLYRRASLPASSMYCLLSPDPR
ncbi:exo-alpha-sialidase [Pyxidicoccus fallax]|uniref:Exo-alpha-sialidase n=1 Tax=Pyxidicoccus fallax TaxID=394095 RepID=A0A848LRD5_9BACT|nr:exo-alpha-sialidase [Pyxidicoccus fallax]NPC81374.1 exo-alpha-sialidase [Pyxidicoccus fallax]